MSNKDADQTALLLFACSKLTTDSKAELQKPTYCYTMGCPPVRGDNPRALASGLCYVHMDKHGISILYHLY